MGNIIGPQFFLDSQKPHYSLGIGAMIFSFLLMAVCGVLYWSVFVGNAYSELTVYLQKHMTGRSVFIRTSPETS